MKIEKTLTIEFNDSYHEFLLSQNHSNGTISGNIKDEYFISGYKENPLTLAWAMTKDDNKLEKIQIKDENNCWDLKTNERKYINDINISVWNNYNEYIEIYTEVENSISFGKDQSNKIILNRSNEKNSFQLINIDNQWVLRPISLEENVYINGKVCGTLTNLEYGDTILYLGYKIIFQKEYFTFYHQYAYKMKDLIVYSVIKDISVNDYPNFKRSPRTIYTLPEDKIVIQKPPVKQKPSNEGLVMRIIPTLSMVVVTILMGTLMGRGILVFLTAGISIVTLILTVIKFFQDDKKLKKENKDNEQFYLDVLNNTRIKIRKSMMIQRESLILNYPSIKDDVHTAKSFSPLIWNKSLEHNDFMRIRIGVGSTPLSFSIDYIQSETKEDKENHLNKKALDLVKRYKEIVDVPVDINLYSGITGITGERKYIVEQTLSILAHLSLSHSYKDLSIVIVYPEKEHERWKALKWLPHTWFGDRQFKMLIKNGRTRDNILGSLLQVFKERKAKLEQEENQKNIFFSPMLFIVGDMDLISSHGIIEFLEEDNIRLGIHIIVLSKTSDRLPSDTKNIIEIDSDGTSNIIKKDGIDKKQSYTFDRCKNIDMEDIARSLAPINHVENTQSAIPDAITLLEMLDANSVNELNVINRWNNNKAYKTLAAPIGIQGAGEIVYLNLHEKAHGPHGLVAGTTGSGKSETIQTYISTLALSFHPYSVAFLLIDYKGGGMSGLFDNLPHLVGTITNLDGAQTMRALVAIKSELRKRQSLFSTYDVNHIDQYQKIFEEGIAKEPMPHLFIISDEFAELKSEKPEFIKELVSAARIGRSLGIHLILATQKPTGVVDDQIWSNSKFRICLKVQDTSDSNEMLKTPDAASITQPGRGYLQVGNNEVYELFQSAFSGAEYTYLKNAKEDKVDDNIYLFNDLGQTELLTKDFSQSLLEETKESMKITQLDAVVDYLKKQFEKQKLPFVKKPWLPPLEYNIYLQLISNNPNFNTNWEEKKDELTVTIGRIDQPQLQKQGDYFINITNTGHGVVFGSSSMGKSTYLKTIALDLALKYSPEEVNFYIIDYGNNNILSLRDLPHTADWITLEDEEKTGKLIRILKTEMKLRKDILGEKGVSSINLYNKITGEKVPYIIILFDNFDLVRDQQMENMQNMINEIVRDGLSLGIYLFFSASRPGAVRYNVLTGVQNQSALYLIDKSETYAAVGRTELEGEAFAGRGLVKQDGDIYSFQIALPTMGDTEEERVGRFNDIIKNLDLKWEGHRPKAIPVVPEILMQDDFYNMKSTKESIKSEDFLVPIAVDTEMVESYSINFSNVTQYIIVGGLGSGKSNIIKTILNSIILREDNSQFIIFDNDMVKLHEFSDHEKTKKYILLKEEMEEVLEEISIEVKKRKKEYVGYLTQGVKRQTPQGFYKQYQNIFVVINNIVQFVENVGSSNHIKIADLIETSKQTGIFFIISSNAQDYSKSFDPISKYVKSIDTGLLQVASDRQQVWALNYQLNKMPPFAVGEAFDVKAGNVKRIKIPLINKIL